MRKIIQYFIIIGTIIIPLLLVIMIGETRTRGVSNILIYNCVFSLLFIISLLQLIYYILYKELYIRNKEGKKSSELSVIVFIIMAIIAVVVLVILNS